MAFVILGPESEALLDTEDETLFDMPKRYGLVTPLLDRLWDRFYADPVLASAEQVQQLRAEILEVRDAYLTDRRQQLLREKKIRAQDPVVRQQILEKLLATDRWRPKFEELVAVCDEAIAAGTGLTCSSD